LQQITESQRCPAWFLLRKFGITSTVVSTLLNLWKKITDCC
jgi:hypothetical protein